MVDSERPFQKSALDWLRTHLPPRVGFGEDGAAAPFFSISPTPECVVSTGITHSEPARCGGGEKRVAINHMTLTRSRTILFDVSLVSDVSDVSLVSNVSVVSLLILR